MCGLGLSKWAGKQDGRRKKENKGGLRFGKNSCSWHEDGCNDMPHINVSRILVHLKRDFTGLNEQLVLNFWHVIFWILQKKGGTCSPRILDYLFTQGYQEKNRYFPAGGLPIGILSTFVSTWYDWIFLDPLLKLIYPPVNELKSSYLVLWDWNNSLNLCQQTLQSRKFTSQLGKFYFIIIIFFIQSYTHLPWQNMICASYHQTNTGLERRTAADCCFNGNGTKCLDHSSSSTVLQVET